MKRLELMAVAAVAMLLPFVLAGCKSAHAMSSPAMGPHPFSQTERIEDVLSRHADANEDFAATLKEMQTELASISDKLETVTGGQCDLGKSLDDLKQSLKVDNSAPEPSRAAGENPNVPLIDPSQIDTGGTAESATISDATGKSWNLDQFISQYYKRPWTHTGTIDAELAKHGVNISGGELSDDTKEKLHAAIHEKELALAEPTPLAGIKSASDCPDGKCPLRSRSVTVTNQNGSRSSSNVVSQGSHTVNRSYSYNCSGNSTAASRKAARQARRCSGGSCCQ